MSFVKKHILINGIDTSYGMYGDVINSQTLVFLHGWGQDMNSFRDIFALCEEKTLSYITIDLPGFGGTPYLREAWDVGDYADFVQTFLGKIGVSTPIVIGHSFGGRIIIKLAARDKHLFSGMVLIGSAGIRPTVSGLRTYITNIVRPILAKSYMQKVRSFLRGQFGSPDYLNAGFMSDTFRKIINEDLELLLPNIQTKTLLIWGEQDTQTPLSDGEIMEGKISNSELIIFPFGTHFVFQEFPEEVFESIQKFSHSL